MLIAIAVFLYVALDGFDLGVGILFPFAKDARERDQMQARHRAGVGRQRDLARARRRRICSRRFPKAYAAIMPALYAPIILMLIALIFRGVAFEFRHHGRERGKRFWTFAFSGGSIVAAAAQGLVLGGFLQGIAFCRTAQFVGRAARLADAVLHASSQRASLLGYALLGAAWLVFKTEGVLFERARVWVKSSRGGRRARDGGGEPCDAALDPRVTERWGLTMTRSTGQHSQEFAPLPVLAFALVLLIWRDAAGPRALRPYLLTVALFATAYAGLAVSLWPFIVPFVMTPTTAAAADNALALMLTGALPLLPLILAYTAYVYWVFRAKASADAPYH